jgi:hypothetical protein
MVAQFLAVLTGSNTHLSFSRLITFEITSLSPLKIIGINVSSRVCYIVRNMHTAGTGQCNAKIDLDAVLSTACTEFITLSFHLPTPPSLRRNVNWYRLHHSNIPYMAQNGKKTKQVSKFVLRKLLLFLHRGSVIHVRNKCNPVILTSHLHHLSTKRAQHTPHTKRVHI